MRHNNLAWLHYSKKENLEEAEALALKTIDLNPDKETIYRDTLEKIREMRKGRPAPLNKGPKLHFKTSIALVAKEPGRFRRYEKGRRGGNIKNLAGVKFRTPPFFTISSVLTFLQQVETTLADTKSAIRNQRSSAPVQNFIFDPILARRFHGIH